jgi:hypothetical protein
VSYLLVVIVLLIAAVFRLHDLATLPPGIAASEVVDVRITETARLGRIEAFYDLGARGHEGLYGVTLAATTAFTGGGLLGYRFLSVCVGLLTIALVYALGRRLFGAGGGLAAAALMAVAMYPVVLSRTISSEMLLPLWTTATLLALARALPLYGKADRDPSPLPFAALGALLGIGLYLHPANLVLTLFAVLFLAYWLLARHTLPPRLLSYMWFGLVIFIVFGTPYLLSSVQRPDLNGAARVFEPATSFLLESIVNTIGGLIFIGDPNPVRNLPGRPMFDLITATLAALGLAVAVAARRQPRFALLGLALLMLSPTALLAADAPSFERIAPLLPLFALLFGLGASALAHTLTRPLKRPLRIAFVAAAALALFAFNLAWTANDLLVRWPALPAMQAAYHARIGAIAHYLNTTADHIPTVVCTARLSALQSAQAASSSQAQPNGPEFLLNRQLLALMMTPTALPLRYADCGSALVVAAGGDAQQVVLLDEEGLGGVHPYLQTWIAQGVPAPYRDGVLPTVRVLDVSRLLAETIGVFTTTSPASYAPDAPGGRGIAAPPVRFGGNLSFLGDRRTWEGVYAPGGLFSVVSYWRVDGQLPADLRLFTHILADPADCCAAQNDILSVIPASLEPRDVIIQITNIQLPYTLRAGEYGVSVGAYEANTGTRLNVFDGENPRGTRLFLGTLTLQQ